MVVDPSALDTVPRADHQPEVGECVSFSTKYGRLTGTLTGDRRTKRNGVVECKVDVIDAAYPRWVPVEALHYSNDQTHLAARGYWVDNRREK